MGRVRVTATTEAQVGMGGPAIVKARPPDDSFTKDYSCYPCLATIQVEMVVSRGGERNRSFF